MQFSSMKASAFVLVMGILKRPIVDALFRAEGTSRGNGWHVTSSPDRCGKTKSAKNNVPSIGITANEYKSPLNPRHDWRWAIFAHARRASLTRGYWLVLHTFCYFSDNYLFFFFSFLYWLLLPSIHPCNSIPYIANLLYPCLFWDLFAIKPASTLDTLP